jgi:hypothetical protein
MSYHQQSQEIIPMLNDLINKLENEVKKLTFSKEELDTIIYILQYGKIHEDSCVWDNTIISEKNKKILSKEMKQIEKIIEKFERIKNEQR